MAKILLPDWINYECVGCGRCCRRGFNIYCPAADKERLEKTDWAGRFSRLAEKKLFPATGGGYRFGVSESGACLFLDDDNLCLMHKEIGYENKILNCRMYPFKLIHSHGKVHVGVLFSCPAVMENRGAPVASRKTQIEKLLAEQDRLFPPPPFEEEARFDKSRKISYRDLRFLEDVIIEALAEGKISLIKKIVFASELLDRLEACDDEIFTGKIFYETLLHMRERALDEALNGGISAPKVGKLEQALVRQFLNLPNAASLTDLSSSSFGKRFSARLRRAGMALAGLFSPGKIHTEHGAAEIMAVRKVDALHLPEESEELLSRYLRTRFFARMYFGREGQGLTVLSGARLTLSLAALVLWYAKAEAAVRGAAAVSPEDVKRAVLQVEHIFSHLSNLDSSGQALQLLTRSGWPRLLLLHVLLG
jgi:Fe-S-cluster containining protein